MMSDSSKATRNQIIFFLIYMLTMGLTIWLWTRTLSSLALNPIPFRFFEVQANGKSTDGTNSLFCYGSAFIEGDNVWRTCTQNNAKGESTIHIVHFDLDSGISNVLWQIGADFDLQYLTAFVKESDTDYLFVVGDYGLQTVYRASLDGALNSLYSMENQRLIGLHQAAKSLELVTVHIESNAYQLDLVTIGDSVETSTFELLDCELSQDCSIDFAEYQDGTWHYIGNRPADVQADETPALDIIELYTGKTPTIITTVPTIEDVHYSLEDDGILWKPDLLDISAGNIANLYATARPFALRDGDWQLVDLPPQNIMTNEQIESIDFTNHYRLVENGIKPLPSLGISVYLHYYYMDTIWLQFDKLVLSIPEVSGATLRYQDARFNPPKFAVAFTTTDGNFAFLRDGDSYIKFDEQMNPLNGLNLLERFIRVFNTSEWRDIPAQFYDGEGALIKQSSLPILLFFLPIAYLVWGFFLYPRLIRQQAVDVTKSRFDIKYLALIGVVYLVVFMFYIPYFDGILTFL